MEYFTSGAVCDKPSMYETPITKPYMFVVYPHGIYSVTTWINVLHPQGLFARVTSLRIVTLKFNFFVPFFRELLLSFGFISSDKASITHAIHNEHSVVILPGGAAEAMHVHEGIILNKRKGFVKIALETKTPMVPVYNFGEKKTYELGEFDSSFMKWLQRTCKDVFGFTLPCFRGNFIIFPKPVQLFSVIGEPIEIDEQQDYIITDALVDKYHDKFKRSLLALHEKHRKTFDEHEPLNIIC
jgi:hypothetical protein